MRRRVLAIIVLYKVSAEHCVSLSSLLRAASAVGAGELDLAVALHDNTPGANAPGALPDGVEYRQDASNTGLATAYNAALARAAAEGYEWMLTLDQDTELPEAYFRVVLKILSGLAPEVAVVVPQIRASGKIVSPNYFAGGAWPVWFPAGYAGVSEQATYAFNSASLMRVAALLEVGGYSPWFWLDNSDAYVYRQLNKRGKRVYVAGQLVVEHDFSMLNMQERVSPERYRTVLLSDAAFFDLEMNGLAGLERTARLAWRMISHFRRGDSAELRRLTWQALLRRVFRSRKHRIAMWREEAKMRLGAALDGCPMPVRSRR